MFENLRFKFMGWYIDKTWKTFEMNVPMSYMDAFMFKEAYRDMDCADLWITIHKVEAYSDREVYTIRLWTHGLISLIKAKTMMWYIVKSGKICDVNVWFDLVPD